MILHFLTVILRSIGRNRFFTFLNVFGLALSISCCLVIYQFLNQELSYDSFHHKDNIYRVIRQSNINGMHYDIGITSAPFASALANDFPHEIEEVTRMFHAGVLVNYQDKSFIEKNFTLADANFLTFFTFPLQRGNPTTALSQPNFVVLSHELASKYFGNEDPINKVIRVDNQFDLIVTGVFAPEQGNSHLTFDMMGSLQLIVNEPWMNDWWSNNLCTYVRVPSITDAQRLNAAFPDFMTKYFGKDFERNRNRIELKLEPLRDVYFNNLTRFERGVVHGDKKFVYIFASVAVLLIVLACINYANLAVAQATSRATEVGIRKSLGSGRSKIAVQFLTESFVLCVLAVGLALGVVQILAPLIETNFGISFSTFLVNPQLWLMCGMLVCIITLLAGSYPAFLLSSLAPVSVMRREVTGSFRHLFVRKVLVVFQFGISILMITSTIIISNQLYFLRNNDLGFDADNVSIIRLNNDVMRKQYEAFSERLMSNPGVSEVALMSNEPGSPMFDASSVKVEGAPDVVRMRTLWADDAFTATLDIPMLAGRFFSRSFVSDSTQAVVLNKTAVAQLGWTPEEALGKRVSIAQFDSVYKSVVGVIDDFHFISLRDKIEPLIISYGGRSVMAVKMNNANVRETMTYIEQTWDSFGSGFPMEWSFLDHALDQQYRQEANQNKVFNVFSTVSLVIACLGILGLTAMIAVRRTREIGVRKVLAATVAQLCVLLLKEMVILTIVAAIVVTPFAYLLTEKWLESFAYRVSLNPLWFILGALLVFVVSIFTAGSQAFTAARANPVRSLRAD